MRRAVNVHVQLSSLVRRKLLFRQRCTSRHRSALVLAACVNVADGSPPGPSGSMIAGILPLGLSDKRVTFNATGQAVRRIRSATRQVEHSNSCCDVLPFDGYSENSSTTIEASRRPIPPLCARARGSNCQLPTADCCQTRNPYRWPGRTPGK